MSSIGGGGVGGGLGGGGGIGKEENGGMYTPFIT